MTFPIYSWPLKPALPFNMIMANGYWPKSPQTSTAWSFKNSSTPFKCFHCLQKPSGVEHCRDSPASAKIYFLSTSVLNDLPLIVKLRPLIQDPSMSENISTITQLYLLRFMHAPIKSSLILLHCWLSQGACSHSSMLTSLLILPWQHVVWNSNVGGSLWILHSKNVSPVSIILHQPFGYLHSPTLLLITQHPLNQ